MVNRTSFTYTLAAEQQRLLVDILKRGNYLPIRVEHATIAAKTSDCSISLYKSGKCLVQGKGASDFVSFVLEPLVLKAAGLGYDDILNPEAIQPHMGVDESGKGDFFGPIVAAGVYVDADLVHTMREMDVKDSKHITSDKKALALGRDLRRLLGHRFTIVKIGPRTYNRLYAKMRNVNRLLSWAHARVIENLLEKVPDCPKAISDKFGNEDQLRRALMQKGRSIKLEQKVRAESDLAVAAASILARESFLCALLEMGKQYDMEIPKGASSAVREVAAKLASKNGPGVLLETTKCHFRTLDAVLGALKTDRSVLGPDGQIGSKAKKVWKKPNQRKD